MSTAVAQRNFQFKKGEAVQIDWTVLDGEGGSPRDITGWTFSLKVKRTPAAADPSLVTVANAIQSGPAGTLRSTITAAATAGLRGDYAFSLWRTNSGGETCLAEGTMTFDDTTQN